MMDERLLRLAIQAMPDDDFELLVNELAQAALQADGLEVRKMRAPDGGADSLVLRPDGTVVGVLQAKHHVRSINWDDCEHSLDRAVETWRPVEQVIFAFPVNFSAGNQRRLFELQARQPTIDVAAWELAKLVRMLDEHPEVGPRFFGPDARSVQDTVARSLGLRGQTVNNVSELVARARELGAATDELDPNFIYQQSSGPLSVPPPRWEDLPWMTAEIEGRRERVRIDVWARQEAGIGLPTWSFTDDDAGRQAWENARVAMARGEQVEISEGLRVSLAPAPVVVRELAGLKPVGKGMLKIQPVEPVPAAIEVHGETVIAREFDVRPVFPQASHDVAFAGEQDGLWFEVGLALAEAPRAQMSVSISQRFGSSAGINARAAEFLIAFLTCKRLVMSAPGLVPDEGVDEAIEVRQDPEVLDYLRTCVAVYGELAFIERELGIDLPILGPILHEDLEAISTIASALEAGEGTATMEAANKVVPVWEIPEVARQFAEQHTTEREVTYELFGRTISLGLATYELPAVKIIDVRPLSNSPVSPARVFLGPDGDGQMRYRLKRGAATRHTT